MNSHRQKNMCTFFVLALPSEAYHLMFFFCVKMKVKLDKRILISSYRIQV